MKTTNQKRILELMEDSTLLSWHLHFSGQVQGIGFRPHVFKIANRLGINGWVSNDIDGVHLEFNSTTELADLFESEIIDTAPSLARITSSTRRNIAFKEFEAFDIIQHQSKSHSQSSITADFALCAQCRHDLTDSRRKNYPFISCTRCGPRYSITHKLPFDRVHTSMKSYVKCDSCTAEYSNPTDRRFHAQTISCPDCQISLQVFKNDRTLVNSDSLQILDLIPRLWNDGNIIAIKGIGGFLLTCAAQNEAVVLKLRSLKNRPTKPFALMIPSLDYYPKLDNSPTLKTALSNHISPIVLCPKTKIPEEFKSVADNLDKVGIMIPYTPLLQIVLESYNKPIIATSGNISNAPIIFNNKEALENLSSIADYILVHDMDIAMPQDDSVITYAQQSNQKIVLRRSRGMAPNYFADNSKDLNDTILCLGAELKSTFCIAHQQNIYVSQYIGNLIDYDTQNHYTYILDHFINLIHASPKHICIDAHPEYFTHLQASEIAKKYNASITTVQHHKAHFAAILGEHNLIDSKNKILGVIWDGTGLGDDGMIWGSEFFVYTNYTMNRCAHLEYYTHFLQEKMAAEARVAAFAILYSEDDTHNFIREKFTDEEWQIYSTLIKNKPSLKTSSMGRLFDAAACVLGLLDKQTFEGEAAMQLELMARRYLSSESVTKLDPYQLNSNTIISATNILIQMIEDLNAQNSIELIAAKFHLTLVNWIVQIARSEGCHSVAFSGGVFQNSVLVDLIHSICKEEFSLHFHNELSPNDENISYGQYIYFKMIEKLT